MMSRVMVQGTFWLQMYVLSLVLLLYFSCLKLVLCDCSFYSFTQLGNYFCLNLPSLSNI